MTPRDALDRIAALCDEAQRTTNAADVFNVPAVRAILAEVTPEPGVTLTPSETAMVVQLYRIIALGVGSNAMLPGTSALVARLEAAQ